MSNWNSNAVYIHDPLKYDSLEIRREKFTSENDTAWDILAFKKKFLLKKYK